MARMFGWSECSHVFSLLLYVVVMVVAQEVSSRSVVQARTGCEDVPEQQDVLLPNPSDCSTYIQCVHQRPVVRPCPPGLHWSVSARRCDWPQLAHCHLQNSCELVPDTQDVLLPNPDDCTTYIQCVHQKPMVRPCPSGLRWNDATKQCDWPDAAHCPHKTVD